MKIVARMALAALVIGTSVTISATERVTLPLVLAGSIGWSFVPILQLLTGLLLVRGVAHGGLRALDGYFATGWPWLLWILAMHAVLLTAPAVRSAGLLPAATAAIPMLWTMRLLVAFCHRDLGMGRLEAWRRVAMHQSVTYLLVLAYVSFAVALWPRIVGLFA